MLQSATYEPDKDAHKHIKNEFLYDTVKVARQIVVQPYAEKLVVVLATSYGFLSIPQKKCNKPKTYACTLHTVMILGKGSYYVFNSNFSSCLAQLSKLVIIAQKAVSMI